MELDFFQIASIVDCDSSHQVMRKLDLIYLQRSECTKMIVHEIFNQYPVKDIERIIQFIAGAEKSLTKKKKLRMKHCNWSYVILGVTYHKNIKIS